VKLGIAMLVTVAVFGWMAWYDIRESGDLHSHPTAVGGERIRYSHRHLPGAEHLHHDGYEFRRMTHRDRRLPRGWDGISPKPPNYVGNLVRAQRKEKDDENE